MTLNPYWDISGYHPLCMFGTLKVMEITVFRRLVLCPSAGENRIGMGESLAQ
jgi:hypothetical protein